MCDNMCQAFECTKHMLGNMVTGKPSTWLKLDADFPLTCPKTWSPMLAMVGEVQSLQGGSRGQWGIACKVMGPGRERGIDGEGWRVRGQRAPTCRVFMFTLQG
jgi:hypothetical protein